MKHKGNKIIEVSPFVCAANKIIVRFLGLGLGFETRNGTMSWMICRGRRESVGFDADKDELPVTTCVG